MSRTPSPLSMSPFSVSLPPPSLLAGILLLAGCSGGGGALQGDFVLELEQPGEVPTVRTVSWTPPEQGDSWLEYGLDGQLDQTSPVVSGAEDQVQVDLLGLKAGGDYQVRGVTETADGTRYESVAVPIEVEQRPAGIPGYDLVVNDEELVQPGGYVLFTVMQADYGWLAMVDRDGDLVWWHDAGPNVVVPTVQLAKDGRTILYPTYDVKQVEDVGMLHRVDLRTGEELQTRTELAHHGIAELPDDQVAWIAYSTQEMRLQDGTELVTGDAVFVGPEGMEDDDRGAADRIFDLFDLLDVELRCQHASEVLSGTGGLDWSHANSLVYQEDDDSLIINFRHLDTLAKLDARTGQVIWSLGDVDLGNPLRGPDHPLDHPHFSDYWDGGLLAFDNSPHRDDITSRLVQLSIDEEAGTYDEVWSYKDPDGNAIQILGDARRLPNGGVLSSWASIGSIREIFGGQVVWRLDSDIGGAVGRLLWISDLYDMQPEIEPGVEWTAR